MLSLSISAHDPLRTIRRTPGCADQSTQPDGQRAADRLRRTARCAQESCNGASHTLGAGRAPLRIIEIAQLGEGDPKRLRDDAVLYLTKSTVCSVVAIAFEWCDHSGAAIKNTAGMSSALLSPHRILKSTHASVVALGSLSSKFAIVLLREPSE